MCKAREGQTKMCSSRVVRPIEPIGIGDGMGTNWAPGHLQQDLVTFQSFIFIFLFLITFPLFILNIFFEGKFPIFHLFIVLIVCPFSIVIFHKIAKSSFVSFVLHKSINRFVFSDVSLHFSFSEVAFSKTFEIPS